MPEILTRTKFDAGVRVQIREDTGEDDEQDYAGWWCVATKPFPCPGDGCDFVARHLTAAHLIVVWPEKDDPDLLRFAGDAHRLGRNPRVAEWEPELGPCISYFRWVRIGRPVHGVYARPGGWRDARPD